MLQLQNLSTGFPKSNLQLHQNIHLQLLPGSLVLLIGPNGIGKSVLLKTLCGLQPATEGSVHVNNTNIHIATAEIRASLTSILLATPPNIEQMTVYDMVVSGRQRFLNGWRNPSLEDANAVQQAMQKTGISHLTQTNFGSLSDGVKQKVMLARCLAQDSEVILLDEPLAFLDYPSRIQFLDLLKVLAKSESKIILYSSHDLQLSLNYCDHVLALTHKQWQFFADPQSVIIADIFPNP
ncbi:MAG: ABC transporter ATP-binding protein [Bacteroidota bacterium]|nr:ABC transporter ATP-binding protein [Bacteroidota bacterium]